jgi:hypothetical protein
MEELLMPIAKEGFVRAAKLLNAVNELLRCRGAGEVPLLDKGRARGGR